MLIRFGILSFALILGSLANAGYIEGTLVTNDGGHIVVHQRRGFHAWEGYKPRILPVADIKYTSDPSSPEVTGALGRMDKGLHNPKMKNVFQAIPVTDEKYHTTLLSYDISPYVSLGLYQKIKSEKSCDLDNVHVGSCIVIENDSASGSSVTTAYYIGTHLDGQNPTMTHVYRIPVDSKKFKNDMAIVLTSISKAKVDGIYTFSNAASANSPTPECN